MKFSIKELKRILEWFESLEESLGDDDLKLYDKINSMLDDEPSEGSEGSSEDWEYYDGFEEED